MSTFGLTLVVLFTVVVVVKVSGVTSLSYSSLKPDGQTGKPIYNVKRNPRIVEMVEALQEGANGFSIRVTFHPNGLPNMVCPWDIASELFTDYVTFLESLIEKNSTKSNGGLMLQIFELDLRGVYEEARQFTGPKVIEALARMMANSGDNFVLILLVQKSEHMEAFKNLKMNATIQSAFKNKIGFGFINGRPTKNVEDLIGMGIESRQIILELAQEVFFPYQQLIEALNLKREKKIAKVFVKTGIMFEGIEAKRDHFRNGADAIITDKPSQVTEIIREPEFSGKIRLATADDNPFLI